MEHAFCLTKKVQLISVAKSGIGIIKNVLNAQPDGHSQVVHVYQSIIYANHSIKVEFVLNATKDIFSKEENAIIGN